MPCLVFQYHGQTFPPDNPGTALHSADSNIPRQIHWKYATSEVPDDFRIHLPAY